jgi:crotonobetainyl-CoA:carnitine CoA-transferase CaiB-like acyl-CoA transferase
MTIFEGLRVVDLTHGQAGAIATMILADNGAAVTRVEPPPGSGYRGDPSRSSGGRRQWHRGKVVETLDLRSTGGRRRALELLAVSDVVVDAFRPGVMEKLGLGWDELSAANPGLVGCSITGFGPSGPYRDLPGYEAVVLAVAGKMTEFGAGRGRPSYVAVPFLSYAAAQSAVHGICGALLVRQATGAGQRVETSLLACLSPFDILDGARHALAAAEGSVPPVAPVVPAGEIPVPASLAYLTSRTADGAWVQWANVAPHLFWAEAELLGFGDKRSDPAFAALPMGATDPAVRSWVWEAVLAGTATRTYAELEAEILASGAVGCERLRTTQEGMDHPQARHNGDVVAVDDPELGPTEQLGPLAAFSATPSRIGGPRPAAGSWPAPAGGEWPAGGPLAGVTIVEAAAMYAAPFGPALLADYGARVIKLEPLTGDPMEAYYGTGPAKVMQGKERVALDLKAPEAQEVVRRLVAASDVFVHNFRPGVPERLGIDEATLRAANPELIFLYAGAYGADGPFSPLPAYHPSAGAICGNAVLQAGAGAPPPPDVPLTDDDLKRMSARLSRANEGNPDANAALGVATAVLLALVARARHGIGQSVQTTMLGANAYVMSDDWIRYPGKPDRPEPDADLDGVGPAYRLYPAADGWVFLACTNDAEWEAFRAVVPEAGPTPDATELTRVFATRAASEWQATLTAAGVACVRADVPTYPWFLRDDPHAAAAGLLADAVHPLTGPHRRHAPLARLSATPAGVRSSEPLGASTRQVLAELGYDPQEIEDLAAKGIIGLG